MKVPQQSDFVNCPVALAPSFTAPSMLADVFARLSGCNPVAEQADYNGRVDIVCGPYGTRDPSKKFPYADGTAIIPISGILLNRFPYNWGFVCGYNYIRDTLQAAMLDPDVEQVVFDVNTPGGVVFGVGETAKFIRDYRGTKPMIAVVDATCCSAGYYLMSAADRILMTESGRVGCIGTIWLAESGARMLDSQGIDITVSKSGEHKGDGFWELPATPGLQAEMDKTVAYYTAPFFAFVAESRKIKPEVISGLEARTLNADEAIRIGLIDATIEPGQTVRFTKASLYPDGEDDDVEERSAMTVQPAATVAAPVVAPVATTNEQVAAAATEAATAAVKAERDRTAGILALDEAKGRRNLADFLIANGTAVDTAKGILAAAALEKTEATNPLDAAMGATGGGAGATAGGATDETKPDPVSASAILRDAALVEGLDPMAWRDPAKAQR